MLDETDRKILTLLQRDARIPNAEIARTIGMAPSAVLERIRKLEEKGIIREYVARLDPSALGRGLLAFVFVRSDERIGDVRTAPELAKIPGVLEVHHIAGEDCYMVKVRALDTESLGRLLRDRFGAIPTIRSTRTTIVLGTSKESLTLPIESDLPADAEEVHA
jgi:Lrp/AsnC family leucine-responsive transcriptional regulator